MKSQTGKNLRALLLFSGGLDSILAAKILKRQGIDVSALTFVSYFFDAEQAKKSARENNIKLRVEDFSGEHFKIVKKPRFGRGAGMNPCIDCHLLMLKQAKKIAGREKFDIIATGEVLGQRPMSQNAEALKLIEREAGLVGKILRPLSENVLHRRAKLSGGMYGISGRSRKGQIALAKKYKIKKYPSPAGGCILTDKEYSQKLCDLLEKSGKIKSGDITLLRLGRHFWRGKVKIILGRNHAENIALKKLAEKGDLIIEPKDIPGPTALVRGEKIEVFMEAAKDTAKEKILQFIKKGDSKKFEFTAKKV